MELQQAIEEVTKKLACITEENFGEGYFLTQQVRDKYYYRRGEAVGLRKALDIMEKVELPKEEPLVVLPKVIATLLERCKASGYCLASSLRLRTGDPIFLNEQEQMEYQSWIRFRSYQERFAMAWVKGFELAKGKRWIVNYDGVFLAKPVETDDKNVFSVVFQKEYAHRFESNEEAYKNSKLVSPFATVEEVEIDE